MLNCNDNFMHDSPVNNPFVESSLFPHIGDVNTSCCYLKPRKALVKKTDVAMILQTIIVLDMIQVNAYGNVLQMDPMTSAHGLTKTQSLFSQYCHACS